MVMYHSNDEFFGGDTEVCSDVEKCNLTTHISDEIVDSLEEADKLFKKYYQFEDMMWMSYTMEAMKHGYDKVDPDDYFMSFTDWFNEGLYVNVEKPQVETIYDEDGLPLW